MDDRPGSPEFDVVSDGDRSGKFRHRSERFSTSSGRNATNLRAANENGANRLAANTNKKVNRVETVNLRVRNMGNITVKKEPESDEDREVSYSLSSLLQECDFVEAPRKKSRSLKSPTSLAIARSKSMEAARPVTGRSRQTLENVISSLKSARGTDTNKPAAAKRGAQFQNPVVPISMPSQIISVAPTSQSTLSFHSSGALGGTGPQIVDVRSLATGAQTRLSVAPTSTARSSTVSKPVAAKLVAPKPIGLALNAGHPRRVVSSLPVTTAPSTGSRVQASIAKPVVSLAPKPLNIRFVLPATEPFNSSEFQQILQTALASVISQSKGIEANLLQQAIQAALTAVTQSSLPLNADQLKQAILSSLVALSSSASTTTQATTLISSKAVVRLPQAVQPQAAQRHPHAPVPLLSQTPSQSPSNISTITGTNKLPATSPGNIMGLSTASQFSSPATVIPTVTTATQIVTKENSPIANGGSQLVSGGLTSSPAQPNHLNLARDAVIKALQEKRVWNSPLSLPSSSSSSTSSSTSGASTSDTVPDTAMDTMDSFDEPCSGSPPPPVLPTSTALTVNSTDGGKSNIPTSSAMLNTTRIANTAPQTATFTTRTSAPLVALRPNISPMSSAVQTALRTVSLQLLPTQGSSSAFPLTSTLTPVNTATNLIGRTNPLVQFPRASLPTQLLEYSIMPLASPKVPITRPVVKTYTAAQTQTAIISKGCSGGCCQYCRTCHENNNRCGLPSCQKTYPSKDALRKHYYFNPTHKLQIPQVRGSSTSACENFLPAELGDLHRKARLRELFRRLPDDEIKELVLPRVAKVISLFQLLEQKSLRVSVGSVSAFKMFTEFERFRKEVEGKLLEMILTQAPPVDKSQSKASTDSSVLNSKDSGKPSDSKPLATNQSTQGCQTTLSAEAAKQGSKDMPPSNTVTSSQKHDSSVAQSNTNASSTAGSSETTKKTVETICIDSNTDAPTAKTADKAAIAGSQSGSLESSSTDKTTSKQDHQEKAPTAVATGTGSVEDKKASDSPSVKGKDKESGVVTQSAKLASATKSSVESLPSKESENKESESKTDENKEGEPMKQSSSSPQSLELGIGVNESTASSDSKSSDSQPPQSEQPNEMAGRIAGESTSKDSTSVPMEIDELSMKDVVAADSKLPDVIMVDDQKETESCSKEGELKSSEDQTKESHDTAIEKADVEMEKEATVCNAEEDKAVVCTGEERQDLATTSSDEQTGVDDKKQSDKPPDLSSKESEKTVDLAEIKDSAAAEKEVDNSADATQEGKMAEKPADGETKMAAMDVEEQGNNSKTDSEEGQAVVVADEKTDKDGTKEDKAKSSNDRDGSDEASGKNEKSNMDAEAQIKAGKQQEAVTDKAEGTQEEGVETADVDSAGVSGNEKTPEVSMETDQVEVENTKVGDQVNKDASKEKTSLEKPEGNQTTEVSSGKVAETIAESTKQKESQEPCTVSDKGEESVNASSSVAASSSNTASSSTAHVSSVAASSSSNTASCPTTVVSSVSASSSTCSNTTGSSTAVVSSVAVSSSSNTAGSSTTVAASSSSNTAGSSTTVVSSVAVPSSSNTAGSSTTVAASSSSNTAGSSTAVVSSVAASSSSNTTSSSTAVVSSVATSSSSNTAGSSTVVSSVAAPSSSNIAGSSTTVAASPASNTAGSSTTVATSSSSNTADSSTIVVSSPAPSSRIIICRSSSTTGDSTSAGSSNSTSKASGESTVVKKRKTLEETIEELSDEDEDEIDENNLLDFSLPYAVRWGRIIKRVQAVQARKIARKENYSEQDMKHFIYHKPKDAANAVIIADCHAHPSFFRAYVMPALLDKHIDDFGLFGKKILSRLYLPKDKYVQVLRSGIGPELAKILGINIFPTFKRIQDTWTSIKRPLGASPYLPKAVIAIEAEDDREVPDEVVAIAPAEKTAGPMNKNVQSAADKATDSLKRPSPMDSVQNDNNKKQRLDTPDAQKDINQSKEANKEQTESSDKAAQKDAASQLSGADKEQTKSPEKVTRKDAAQLSEADKGKKPDETDSSKKDAQNNKNQPDENNRSQTGKSDSTHASDQTPAPGSEKDKTGSTSSTSVPEKGSAPQPDVDNADGPDTDGAEPMSVDQEQDPKSSDSATKEGSSESSVAVEKSTRSTSSAQTNPKVSCSIDKSPSTTSTCSTSSTQTTPKALCSTDKPPSTTASTSAKTCASTIIPAKATIYTSGSGKKGASSVPFPASKGSPLFLIPVEKISPKLVEQFIAQGKGDGVKTRSSDKKKPKQSKQVSQVLVLIPSTNPNGSPTIQTLTSAEQLKSTGDKKPLLLLPADKVPKSIASQSQTVRRKMVITMVAPSSEAASGTKSAASSARSATTTSTSTAGGQSDGSTSAVQSVKGPIMSVQEGKSRTASGDGNSNSDKPPATGSDSSDAVDKSAKSLASVVSNTSALNLSTKDSSLAAGTQSGSGAGPMDVDKAGSPSVTGSNKSDSQADKGPSSASDSPKESDSNKVGTANQSSVTAAPDAATSATTSGEADIDDNRSAASSADLDLLESSLLPSDFMLDNLLKDISADGSGSEVNEMPPLDVSEIISSFEEMPLESNSSTPASSSICDTVGDTAAVDDPSEGANESQMASGIQDKPSLQDEHNYASTRRQSPRRTPALSKSASGSSSTDVPETASPNTSGGSKGDSDVEEGSPPRKRRKTPTRTSARSSPQVTAVSDKGAAAKSPLNTPYKGKGRKL